MLENTLLCWKIQSYPNNYYANTEVCHSCFKVLAHQGILAAIIKSWWHFRCSSVTLSKRNIVSAYKEYIFFQHALYRFDLTKGLSETLKKWKRSSQPQQLCVTLSCQHKQLNHPYFTAGVPPVFRTVVFAI